MNYLSFCYVCTQSIGQLKNLLAAHFFHKNIGLLVSGDPDNEIESDCQHPDQARKHEVNEVEHLTKSSVEADITQTLFSSSEVRMGPMKSMKLKISKSVVRSLISPSLCS